MQCNKRESHLQQAQTNRAGTGQILDLLPTSGLEYVEELHRQTVYRALVFLGTSQWASFKPRGPTVQYLLPENQAFGASCGPSADLRFM